MLANAKRKLDLERPPEPPEKRQRIVGADSGSGSNSATNDKKDGKRTINSEKELRGEVVRWLAEHAVQS